LKFTDLKSDPIIIEWIDTISPKKSTEYNYIRAMVIYSEYAGKSPNELITEAEKEIKAGLLPRERTVKRNLIGFRKYLQDKKLSPLSVKSYMTRITNFYKAFDIEIPKIPKSERKAQPLPENYCIPTKEDLQEVLKVCDLMETAIVLVGASSGLSAQEIVNLKVKDFKKGYDPITEITTLKLRREKVGFDFITFLSPECSRAVNAYLEYRNREIKTGDKHRINQIKKQNVTNDNGFLFIGRLIPPEFLKTSNEALRKLEVSALLQLYRTISEKARKNTPMGNWNLIRSHNVRKYFNSAMLNAGADSFHVEFFMGHTLDDTKAAYFRANPEKLRDLYQKFIPYLTIQKELDISESDDYRRIKDENEILRAETQRHIVERTELQALREEIEKLKATETARVNLIDEFRPYIEEDRKHRQEVEDFFGVPFSEAVEIYNLDVAMTPYSDEYKAHVKRLREDDAYRERHKEAVSRSRQSVYDRDRKNKTEELLNMMRDALNTK
jgi:integrase